MENYVAQQMTALGVSALLGATAGLIYDLLRTLRIRRKHSRLLTHLSDAVYVLLVLLGLFRLALTMGAGELRLYMMVGTLLGASIYFWLPARLLRPLWDFWLGVSVIFLHLLWRPVEISLGALRKMWRYTKKHFSFSRKYSKIKVYLWKFVQFPRRGPYQRRRTYGKPQKKTEKQ